MNIQEFIAYADGLIESQKSRGKNTLGLGEAHIEDSEDIVTKITAYYNLQGIACRMKKCPTKKAYEVVIWW